MKIAVEERLISKDIKVPSQARSVVQKCVSSVTSDSSYNKCWWMW